MLVPSQMLVTILRLACAVAFMAAAAFLQGRQDLMPEVLRGSLALVALARAPLVRMVSWLVRLRLT